MKKIDAETKYIISIMTADYRRGLIQMIKDKGITIKIKIPVGKGKKKKVKARLGI